MADFTMKQDDLEPPLEVTLVGADGHPAPLVTAESIKVRVTNVLDQAHEIINADATLENADTGDISYAFDSGDTSTAGTYYVDFVVTWPGSRPQTYPPSGHLVLVIEPKL